MSSKYYFQGHRLFKKLSLQPAEAHHNAHCKENNYLNHCSQSLFPLLSLLYFIEYHLFTSRRFHFDLYFNYFVRFVLDVLDVFQ